MLKRKIIITIWILIFPSIVQANLGKYPYSYYTQQENEFLFKFKPHYLHVDGSLKGNSAEAAEENNIADHGLGAEASVTYFFNKYVAAELSAGLTYIFPKEDDIALIRDMLGAGREEISEDAKPQLYYLPATITLQYHLAPYGAVRPYLGGGYQAAFFYSREIAMKIEHTHGALLQAGINFMLKDDTILTVDFKKSFLKSKAIFKASSESDSAANSEINLDPITISIGIGLKF